MALVSGLLSLLVRQLGSLLRAVFGWSIMALFGRLSSKMQTAVSVALLLSALWPLFLLGVAFPGLAAWAIAFVPLHKMLSPTALRIIWCALAVITPPVVGLITRWVAPSKKGTTLTAALNGFPLTLGYFCAFVVTVVTVPLVKIASAVRRWSDEHVFVQSRKGRYEAVVHDLAEACASAGVTATIEKVPLSMALSTKVLLALARGAVNPLVAEDPKMLRGDGIEIYVYPADLMLRGVPRKLALTRAAMTRTRLDRDAYLVQSPRAQELQDELARASELGPNQRARARSHAHDISREVDQADIPFDDWTLLEQMIQRIMLESYETPEVTAMAPESKHAKLEHHEHLSTPALVEEAMREAKALIRVEVELAKDEVKKDVTKAEGAAISAAVGVVFLITCTSMLAVALVLALGGTPVVALLVAASLAVIAGGLGVVAYALFPKKPLDETRHRLAIDAHQIKEHAV